MKVTIKPENQFKKVLWKNGKGETTELAISEGGTLSSFDWRISIASVAENGVFSNFSGYTRNLTLIKGQGIDLQHDNGSTDHLVNILDVAVFDGGNHTRGKLYDGEITDFNVIVSSKKYHVKTINSVESNTIKLIKNNQYFVYTLLDGCKLCSSDNKVLHLLPVGYLMHIEEFSQENIYISGEMMIIVELKQVVRVC